MSRRAGLSRRQFSLTPGCGMADKAQFAEWILTSLGIVRQKDGCCSYPTETAQFSYDRATDEVQKWLTRYDNAAERRGRIAGLREAAAWMRTMRSGSTYLHDELRRQADALEQEAP